MDLQLWDDNEYRDNLEMHFSAAGVDLSTDDLTSMVAPHIYQNPRISLNILHTLMDVGLDVKKHMSLFFNSPNDISKALAYLSKNNMSLDLIEVAIGEVKKKEADDFIKRTGISRDDFAGVGEGDTFLVKFNDNVFEISADGKKLLRPYQKLKVENGVALIPPFVEEIGEECFELSIHDAEYRLSIPSHIKKIGEKAFKGCVIRSVEFEGELETLEESTFENVIFREFIWPKKLKSIGVNCFKNATDGHSLKDMLYWYPSLEEQQWKKRLAQGDMEKIWFGADMPETVEVIKKGAFSENEYIRVFIGSKSLKKVEEGALDGCGGIISINLPRDVETFCPAYKSPLRFSVVSYGPFTFSSSIRTSKNPRIGFSNRHELVSNIIRFARMELYAKDNAGNNSSLDFRREMLEMIVRYGEKEFYPKMYTKFSQNIFDENMYYLITMGVPREALVDIVVQDRNNNLFDVDINNLFQNYDYLKQQKIIPEESLKRLIFLDVEGESVQDLFKNYYSKYGKLPELTNALLVESNDKGKLELRDRLVYIATMQLLDGEYNSINYRKAVSMMGRTLYENVIVEDEIDFTTISREPYALVKDKYPAMAGIMIPLYNKLNGIEPQIFNLLYDEMKKEGNHTYYYEFYNSLETIKHWGEYGDDIERATRLKNEIVARLLYADIKYYCGDGPSDLETYIRLKQNPSLLVQRREEDRRRAQEILDRRNRAHLARGESLEELEDDSRLSYIEALLKYGSGQQKQVFKDFQKVTTMLGIDPYAFDALRRRPSDVGIPGKKSLEAKAARIAVAQGYLFSEEDLAMYRKSYGITKESNPGHEFNMPRTIDSYINCITNSVGLAKIPDKDKEKYLQKIRLLAKAYIANKREDELFDFSRAFDLYLRNNNEYIVQGVESEDTARVVFDRDSGINNDARIMYCLYNLNRIAHNTLELNCKAAIKQKFRVATSGAVTYERMEDVFSAYNRLYRYGFSQDSITVLTDPGIALAMNIGRDTSGMSTDELKNLNSGLLTVFNGFRQTSVREQNLTIGDVPMIKANLELISNMTDVEKELISTSVKEQGTFFECKQLFSVEVMKRLAKGFSNDFKSMVCASLEDKQAFYAENGFVAEIQVDGKGKKTLVCLCEDFVQPFSIHLKDLPEEIQRGFDGVTPTETIAHCSLNGQGLLLRDSEFESDILSVNPDDNFVGFKKNPNKLLNAVRSNYDNYDVPARTIRSYRTTSELDVMFEENSSNTNGVIEVTESYK